MPSFDVVSEVDMQEVRNAVDQAQRELGSRFDFRGVEADFELTDAGIRIAAEEEFQLAQMEDILRDKMVKRKIDVSCLDPGEVEGAGKQKRRTYALKQGIDRDSSKKITKLAKDSKLKIQAQVNGEKVRITGKKRDDLQSMMTAIRELELGLPLQFDNFRD
jgi:uncharacterized protein YajQ (UPF0234 family)